MQICSKSWCTDGGHVAREHESYTVIRLQAQFESAMQSKTTMEAEAAATQRRMDSANALLSALAGEEGRWTQQSQAFDSTIQRLTGIPWQMIILLRRDPGRQALLILGHMISLSNW